jgi:cephalosporin-C deacetylase
MRDPARHHPTSTVRPADFDQFWAEVMGEAARIPLNPTQQAVALRSTADVEVFRIGYDSLDGVRVGAWYCVPRAEPPYPGLLIVPGYVSEPTLPKSWAKLGYATVGVAPRGKLGSNQQYNPGYPGLLVDNIVDRNTYSYRGFYVDTARAVDFLLTRPEVDHTRIGVHGSSQGGALTITTAALRSDVVTCGAAGAPYLCGFLDAARFTHSYPYEEIRVFAHLSGRNHSCARRLHDSINFASLVKCPMLVNLGLQDGSARPRQGCHGRALAGPKNCCRDGAGRRGVVLGRGSGCEAFRPSTCRQLVGWCAHEH